MVDPAFTHILRINRAFGSMVAGVDDYEVLLDEAAATGEPLSLDLAMSHLTADIICRTVFSTSLRSQTARFVEAASASMVFEWQVADVELKRLIFAAPFARIPQHAWVLGGAQPHPAAPRRSG